MWMLFATKDFSQNWRGDSEADSAEEEPMATFAPLGDG